MCAKYQIEYLHHRDVGSNLALYFKKSIYISKYYELNHQTKREKVFTECTISEPYVFNNNNKRIGNLVGSWAVFYSVGHEGSIGQ